MRPAPRLRLSLCLAACARSRLGKVEPVAREELRGVAEHEMCERFHATRELQAIKGHTPNDPHTASEVQKSLMLERFQAENPGFDFSGATFNGQVPDPKSFMGGVGYNGSNY